MTKNHKILLGVAVLALLSLTVAFAINGVGTSDTNGAAQSGDCPKAKCAMKEKGLCNGDLVNCPKKAKACGEKNCEKKETGFCPLDQGCTKAGCGCCDGCKGGTCDCEDCKCCDCCKKDACCCKDACNCCDGCKGGTCDCEDCKCCDCCKK